MGDNTYFTVGYEELWSAMEGVMVLQECNLIFNLLIIFKIF